MDSKKYLTVSINRLQELSKDLDFDFTVSRDGFVVEKDCISVLKLNSDEDLGEFLKAMGILKKLSDKEG